MDKQTLVSLLGNSLPETVAKNLEKHFLQIRRDVASQTLGSAAPGKFVEVFVKALQYLDPSTKKSKQKVDDYLRVLESKSSSLDDGLRICASRVARSIYTLRNKRNIAHIAEVDPSLLDLKYIYSGAQWILSELIRATSNTSMDEACRIVEQVQTPAGSLVEDMTDRRIVFGDLTIREEILDLIHSYYPKPVSIDKVLDSMCRRNKKSVKHVLKELWHEKIMESDKDNYRLTAEGFKAAVLIINKLV